MKNTVCFQCGKKTELEHNSFRAECGHCHADLHVCRNCCFYDPHSYNQCRETTAERVQDKEKNNYCEYFNPNSNTQTSIAMEKDQLLKDAEALFKKDS